MKRAWLDVENRTNGRTERYCLDGFERVVIGSSAFATLRMPRTHYVAEHCALTQFEGRWQLADLGYAGGIWMNEMRMLSARWLDSGDAFWARKEERFRFLEEPVDPRWEEHAARLAGSDDGDEAWMVFSDALQELGDDTGRRMATAGEDPVLPLGLLAVMRSDGTVKLQCRFGFVRRLTVHNVGMARALQHRIFDAVLAQPAVRLLRELVVDVASFEGVPLEAIAAAISRAAPPSLRRVRLSGLLERPPPHLFAPGVEVEWL